MSQSDWKPFHQNDNWAQRLILARECFSEIRAERTEDSPAGSGNVQGPITLTQQPFTPAEFNEDGVQITKDSAC